MNVICLALALILATPPALGASSQSLLSNSGGVGEEQSDKLIALRSAMHAFPGYARLWGRIHFNENTGRNPDIAVEDTDSQFAFQCFRRDLEKAAPGLHNTLPVSFFTAMGTAVASKWVRELTFTYEKMDDFWSALMNSTDPEIVQFLKSYPVLKDGEVYLFEPSTGQKLGSHIIRLDCVLCGKYVRVVDIRS